MLRKLKEKLLQPSDDCGLYPIVARIPVYGIALAIILYFQSEHFDISELVTIVVFSSVIMVVELLWKRVEAGTRLWWHLVSLVMLIGWILFLLSQATQVREWWYRTHVLEKRVHEIICQAPTPIIVMNSNGIIKSINPKFTEITQYEPHEVEGRPFSILIRGARRVEHQEDFDRRTINLVRSGAAWVHSGSRTFKILKKDGTTVRVLIYAFGIRFSDKPTDKSDDLMYYSIIQPYKEFNDDGGL